MTIHNDQPNLASPSHQIIEQMLVLRSQLAALSQQIHDLEPAFFQACAALQTEKITLSNAIISRRLTPGRWCYPPDIITLEGELKNLKQQFQQTHDSPFA